MNRTISISQRSSKRDDNIVKITMAEVEKVYQTNPAKLKNDRNRLLEGIANFEKEITEIDELLNDIYQKIDE